MNARAWGLAQETRGLERHQGGTWSDAAAKRIQGRYLRPHAHEAEDLLATLGRHDRALEAADDAVRETRVHYEAARIAGDEVGTEADGAQYAVSMTHDSARRAHEFETRAGRLEAEAVAATRAADQACAGVPGEHGQTTLGIPYVAVGDREAALGSVRGLAAVERALIGQYTGENPSDPASYHRVNPLLRVGTIAELEASASTITALQNAIASAPVFQGTVYRGTTLTTDQVSRYQAGQRVVEQAFMSASANPAKEFGGNTRFVIESRTGRNIASASRSPGEAEVLYGHSQPFDVVSNKIVGGRHNIVLREVPR
jgi:hypothetical protein